MSNPAPLEVTRRQAAGISVGGLLVLIVEQYVVRRNTASEADGWMRIVSVLNERLTACEGR